MKLFNCVEKRAQTYLKMLSSKCLEMIFKCKKELALNNLKWLIYHKTKVNHTKLLDLLPMLTGLRICCLVSSTEK